MLVLCNGMPRSASTWSYNVVLALLRQATAEEVFGGYDDNFDRIVQRLPASASHAVIKCHFLDTIGLRLTQLGSAKVIYTRRNLADAIASFMAMFKADFDTAIDVMSKSLDVYCHCRTRDALILEYFIIISDPQFSVRKIAEHLDIDVSAAQVAEIVDSNSLAAMLAKIEKISSAEYLPKLIQEGGLSYDPETLLHIDHIRQGGCNYGDDVLSTSQLCQINALLAEKGLVQVQI